MYYMGNHLFFNTQNPPTVSCSMGAQCICAAVGSDVRASNVRASNVGNTGVGVRSRVCDALAGVEASPIAAGNVVAAGG
jgi:hypothetical protein